MENFSKQSYSQDIMPENEVLRLEHDKHFSFFKTIICLIIVLQSIAVFIMGIAALTNSALGLLVWAVGGLAVYISYKFLMFLMSIVYDLKIIRNKVMEIAHSGKDGDDVMQQQQSYDNKTSFGANGGGWKKSDDGEIL